jgi:catechol-2,3-dioxygenase
MPLGNCIVNVVLLATDLDAIKEYYTNKIGLEILEESPGGIRFKAGGDSEISYTKSTVGTADTQTQASFRVPDLAAEVAELRSRGVKIEEYDTPSLKTVDGIADRDFALISWFVDPAGNCISMMQLK